MKSKDDLKTIDPAVLEKILGGVQPGGASDKSVAVIPQGSFSSFFHS
jgi:hypothetical protein